MRQTTEAHSPSDISSQACAKLMVFSILSLNDQKKELDDICQNIQKTWDLLSKVKTKEGNAAKEKIIRTISNLIHIDLVSYKSFSEVKQKSQHNDFFEKIENLWMLLNIFPYQLIRLKIEHLQKYISSSFPYAAYRFLPVQDSLKKAQEIVEQMSEIKEDGSSQELNQIFNDLSEKLSEFNKAASLQHQLSEDETHDSKDLRNNLLKLVNLTRNVFGAQRQCNLIKIRLHDTPYARIAKELRENIEYTDKLFDKISEVSDNLSSINLEKLRKKLESSISLTTKSQNELAKYLKELEKYCVEHKNSVNDLEDILKESQDLLNQVKIIPLSFDFYSEDLYVSTDNENLIKSENLAKSRELRSITIKVQGNTILKEKIFSLLDATDKHLNDLNSISMALGEFRILRYLFRTNDYDALALRSLYESLKKNKESLLQLRDSSDSFNEILNDLMIDVDRFVKEVHDKLKSKNERETQFEQKISQLKENILENVAYVDIIINEIKEMMKINRLDGLRWIEKFWDELYQIQKMGLDDFQIIEKKKNRVHDGESYQTVSEIKTLFNQWDSRIIKTASSSVQADLALFQSLSLDKRRNESEQLGENIKNFWIFFRELSLKKTEQESLGQRKIANFIMAMISVELNNFNNFFFPIHEKEYDSLQEKIEIFNGFLEKLLPTVSDQDSEGLKIAKKREQALIVEQHTKIFNFISAIIGSLLINFTDFDYEGQKEYYGEYRAKLKKFWELLKLYCDDESKLSRLENDINLAFASKKPHNSHYTVPNVGLYESKKSKMLEFAEKSKDLIEKYYRDCRAYESPPYSSFFKQSRKKRDSGTDFYLELPGVNEIADEETKSLKFESKYKQQDILAVASGRAESLEQKRQRKDDNASVIQPQLLEEIPDEVGEPDIPHESSFEVSSQNEEADLTAIPAEELRERKLSHPGGESRVSRDDTAGQTKARLKKVLPIGFTVFLGGLISGLVSTAAGYAAKKEETLEFLLSDQGKYILGGYGAAEVLLLMGLAIYWFFSTHTLNFDNDLRHLLHPKEEESREREGIRGQERLDFV
jgi:hypothetical protein